jgi:hypothetical protein
MCCRPSRAGDDCGDCDDGSSGDADRNRSGSDDTACAEALIGFYPVGRLARSSRPAEARCGGWPMWRVLDLQRHGEKWQSGIDAT